MDNLEKVFKYLHSTEPEVFKKVVTILDMTKKQDLYQVLRVLDDAEACEIFNKNWIMVEGSVDYNPLYRMAFDMKKFQLCEKIIKTSLDLGVESYILAKTVKSNKTFGEIGYPGEFTSAYHVLDKSMSKIESYIPGTSDAVKEIKKNYCIHTADLESFKTLEPVVSLDYYSSNSETEINLYKNPQFLSYLLDKNYITIEEAYKLNGELEREIRGIWQNIAEGHNREYYPAIQGLESLISRIPYNDHHFDTNINYLGILDAVDSVGFVEHIFKSLDTITVVYKREDYVLSEEDMKASLYIEGVEPIDGLWGVSNYLDSIDMSRVDTNKVMDIFTLNHTEEDVLIAQKKLLDLSLQSETRKGLVHKL